MNSYSWRYLNDLERDRFCLNQHLRHILLLTLTDKSAEKNNARPLSRFFPPICSLCCSSLLLELPLLLLLQSCLITSHSFIIPFYSLKIFWVIRGCLKSCTALLWTPFLFFLSPLFSLSHSFLLSFSLLLVLSVTVLSFFQSLFIFPSTAFLMSTSLLSFTQLYLFHSLFLLLYLSFFFLSRHSVPGCETFFSLWCLIFIHYLLICIVSFFSTIPWCTSMFNPSSNLKSIYLADLCSY